MAIGGAVFTVDLAVTGEQRAQGLSGREPLPPATGMLFVFPEAVRLTFWMKDMRFPLDLVWIGSDCRVVDITHNAPPPAPDQELADLPRFSPMAPARYVLEVHAGEANSGGLAVGELVAFSGTLAGQHGC